MKKLVYLKLFTLSIVTLFLACSTSDDSYQNTSTTFNEPLNNNDSNDDSNGGSSDNSSATTNQNFKLLSLGDSYTIGQSVCETCRFPEQLKNSLTTRNLVHATLVTTSLKRGI